MITYISVEWKENPLTLLSELVIPIWSCKIDCTDINCFWHKMYYYYFCIAHKMNKLKLATLLKCVFVKPKMIKCCIVKQNCYFVIHVKVC